MPVQADLHLAYARYFTHENQGQNFIRSACQSLYHLASWVPDALTGLRKAKKRLAAMYLDDMSPGCLLDVGCGDGRFLNTMRLHGWRIDGVEVDPAAVKNADRLYGLKIRQGSLRQANFSPQSFDAITLRHVIEHVHEPVELLKECHRICRPNGRMIIVTPNTESRGHKMFKENWMGLDQPRHLMLFSQNSLCKCAELAGWRKCTTETTAASAEIFMAVSLSLARRTSHVMDATARPEIGRALRAVLQQYQETVALKSQANLGEELVLVARK